MIHLLVPFIVLALNHACATTPVETTESVRTEETNHEAARATSTNQALIVAKGTSAHTNRNIVPGPWVSLDTARMRHAIAASDEGFQVDVVYPVSTAVVSQAIQKSATLTPRDGTLLVLFAGYANERGEITMDDGSVFDWATMLTTMRATPGIRRLVTVVSASLDARWMAETSAMDSARTFPESVIVTSVPRMFQPAGSADAIHPGPGIDEMRESLLHPAASRLLATLRNAFESSKARQTREHGILATLNQMKEDHELLYGSGPVVRVSR